MLKVVDKELDDDELCARAIVKSKQLLGFEGISHANGDYEQALDVARHINAYPGTPGDYRAWIGGTRDKADILALLENIYYGYHRGRIAVMEDLLAEQAVNFELAAPENPQKLADSFQQSVLVNAKDSESIAKLRQMSEQMAAFWGGMSALENEDRQCDIVQRYGADLKKNIEGYIATLEQLGIH